MPLKISRTPTPPATEPRVVKPPTRPPPDIPWLNQLARQEVSSQQLSLATPPQNIDRNDDEPDKVKGSLDEVREYSLSLYRHLQEQLNKRKLNTRTAASIRRRSKRDTHWIQSNGVHNLGGRASRNAIWTSEGVKYLEEMLDAGTEFVPPSDPKELKESFMKLLQFASSKKRKKGYSYIKPDKPFPIGKVMLEDGGDISLELTTAQHFAPAVSKQTEKIQRVRDTGIDASLFLEEILSNEVEGVDNGLFALSQNPSSRLTAALINGFEATNEEAEIFAGPPLADNFEDAEIILPPVLRNQNAFNNSPQTISEAPVLVVNTPHTVIPIVVTTSQGPLKSLPYSLAHHQEQKVEQEVEWESAYAGGEIPVDLLPHHQAVRRPRPRYRFRNRRPYRTRRIRYHDPHYFCPPYDHSHNDTLESNHKHPIFLPRRPAIPPPTLIPNSIEFPRVPTPPEIVSVPEVATISFANPQPALPPTRAPQIPVPSKVPRLPAPSPFVPVEPLTPDTLVRTFRPAVAPAAITTPTPATIPPVPITFRPTIPVVTFRPNTQFSTPVATQPTISVQTPAPRPAPTLAPTLAPTTAPTPAPMPDYESMDEDYNMDEDYYMYEEGDYYDDGVDDGLTKNLANPGTEMKINETGSGGGVIKSFRADLIPVIILVEPDKIPEGAIPMVPVPTTPIPPTTANTTPNPRQGTEKNVGKREKIPVIILVEPDKIPLDSIPINTDTITTATTADPSDYDESDYDYGMDDGDYDTGNGDYDTDDYNEYDEYADGNNYDVDVNSGNDYDVDFDDYDNDYDDSYEYENSGLLPLFPGPRGSARLRNRGRLQGRSRRNRNRERSQRQQRLNQQDRSSRLVQVPSRNQRRPKIQQTRQRNQQPSRFKLTETPVISSEIVNFRDRQQPVFVGDDIPQHKLTGLDLQQNPSRVDTLTGSKERVIPFPSWLDNDYSFPQHEDYYVDDYASSEPQDYYIPPKQPDYRDYPDVTVPRVPVARVRPNSRRASSPNFIGGKIPVAGQLPRPGTRSRGLPNFPTRREPIPRNPPLSPFIPSAIDPTPPNVPFFTNPQPPLLPRPREPLIPVAPPPPLALPNPRPAFIPVAGNDRNPGVNRPRQPFPQIPNTPIQGIPVAGTGRNPGVIANRGSPGVNRPRQPFPRNPNAPIPGNREVILPGSGSSGFSPGRDIEIQTIPNPRNRNSGNLQPRIPQLQDSFSNEFEDFGEDFEVFRPGINLQNGAIPEKISELRHSIVSKARSWTQFGLQRTRPEFIKTRRPVSQPQHVVIFQ